jgi:DNA-binding CsgD family transcriptional regulator
MARSALSEREVAGVLEAAETFLEVASIEELRQCAVDTVASLLPETVVSWNEVDLNGGQLAMVRSEWPPAPTDADQLRKFDEAFIANVMEHPVIARYERTRDGRPYAISDFLSAADFHRTNLYQLMYGPLGIEDQISFVLPDPNLVIGIAANRRRRGFPARERMVCNLLRAHLVHASRNLDALARAKQMLALVHQLADDHGEAVLVLDRHGTPDRMSAQAHDLLEQFFGPGDPTTLPSDIKAWLEAQAASAPFLHRQTGRSLIVRRVNDGERELLFLSPKSDTISHHDAQQLGLTRREAEIVALLTDGMTSKRIAAGLGISPRTVDKHVATILDKLGVRTRLEAVSLLAHQVPTRTADRWP